MLWYFQVNNKVTQLSVQFSSVTQSCPTICNPRDQSTPGLPVHHQLKLMSIESVMPSNHLILCHPVLLLPSIFPRIRAFSNESVPCIRWPKYWSFSFSINHSNEYSGLISFRIGGLISLQSKGLSRIFSNTTFKSINSSVFSFLYGPTLTSIHDYWTIVWLDGLLLAMSLLFNMFSRLVIAFLPRSKRFLISWLQSQPAVILEPKKIKV